MKARKKAKRNQKEQTKKREIKVKRIKYNGKNRK